MNNLYTKVIYGGEGSNKTIQKIIEESTLIQIFRDIHISFEKNLALTHLSKEHGDTDMASTFADLLAHIMMEKTHQYIPGRRSQHLIHNLLADGQ